ncbi:hypothetical protein NIES2101_10355 [Calothrix sp. HK-06]|nr:hypothetical protein NIES2101_10355 [Calothrix sp. HK-06]
MQLNSKYWRRLILSVVSVCSFSLAFAQTAQAQELRSLCGEYDGTYVAAETEHFLVSICGGDIANSYIGLDKRTGKSIWLPLTENGSSTRGYYYEAVNDEYTYAVNLSPKYRSLSVIKNGRVILREPIVRELN